MSIEKLRDNNNFANLMHFGIDFLKIEELGKENTFLVTRECKMNLFCAMEENSDILLRITIEIDDPYSF